MATFEDRILGEKLHYYCSSDEEEIEEDDDGTVPEKVRIECFSRLAASISVKATSSLSVNSSSFLPFPHSIHLFLNLRLFVLTTFITGVCG